MFSMAAWIDVFSMAIVVGVVPYYDTDFELVETGLGLVVHTPRLTLSQNDTSLIISSSSYFRKKQSRIEQCKSKTIQISTGQNKTKQNSQNRAE